MSFMSYNSNFNRFFTLTQLLLNGTAIYSLFLCRNLVDLFDDRNKCFFHIGSIYGRSFHEWYFRYTRTFNGFLLVDCSRVLQITFISHKHYSNGRICMLINFCQPSCNILKCSVIG